MFVTMAKGLRNSIANTPHQPNTTVKVMLEEKWRRRHLAQK